MERNRIIAEMANRYGICPVGLVRPGPGLHGVRLLVSGQGGERMLFAEELAEVLNEAVTLYDPHALPYSHPAHYGVKWLGNGVLPKVAVPRGATVRKKGLRLRKVRHFVECDAMARHTGSGTAWVDVPPVGGFLL